VQGDVDGRLDGELQMALGLRLQAEVGREVTPALPL
jgi:hypothetical protein